MKKMFFLILSISFAFFIDIFVVDAANLVNTAYTVECIYTDGSLFSYEYSVGKGEHITNRLSYNLTGTSNRDTNSGGDISFVNSMFSPANENVILTCPSVVYNTSYNDITWYKFGSNFTACDDEGCPDFQISNSGWCKFWGCSSGDVEKGKTAIANAIKGDLVSERYILGNNASEPNATLYYVMPSEQAAGANSYIKIMVYDNVVLLEKDGRVTQVEMGGATFSNITSKPITDSNGNVVKYEYENFNDSMKVIWINSPEPIPSTSSSSTISYSFNANQKRYKISFEGNSVFSNRYEWTDSIPNPNSLDDDLCNERLKNTAPIIKDLIKYSQILLPIIVIVITSIDIGRVVVAGNIEEELPKKRKMIIHRLIMIIIFFFLPLFVRIFISLIKESGIGDNNQISNSIEYIDCLFK